MGVSSRLFVSFQQLCSSGSLQSWVLSCLRNCQGCFHNNMWTVEAMLLKDSAFKKPPLEAHQGLVKDVSSMPKRNGLCSVPGTVQSLNIRNVFEV